MQTETDRQGKRKREREKRKEARREMKTKNGLYVVKDDWNGSKTNHGEGVGSENEAHAFPIEVIAQMRHSGTHRRHICSRETLCIPAGKKHRKKRIDTKNNKTAPDLLPTHTTNKGKEERKEERREHKEERRRRERRSTPGTTREKVGNTSLLLRSGAVDE
ncbi:MAG TPA: hypothetical protein V6C97_00760 [Oculatellaceae cyanobacterium]